MSTDDQDGNGKPPHRGGNEAGRDPRGRWLPDHCPNPSGRRGNKKKPGALLDQADIRHFGNTMIEVVTNGKKETMDRRTALNNKMYESAMKGRVTMQRYLCEKFEENDRRLAAAIVHYERLVQEYIIDNPKFDGRDGNIPFEVQSELAKLEDVLSHYFPGQYPFHGKRTPDDCNPDDGEDEVDDADDGDADG